MKITPKTIIINGAVSLLTALGMVGVMAPTAFANYDQCPNGVGCAFDLNDGQGTRWQFPVGTYGVGACWNAISSTGLLAWNSAVNRYGDWNGHRLTLFAYGNHGCDSNGTYALITSGFANNLSVLSPYNLTNANRSFIISP